MNLHATKESLRKTHAQESTNLATKTQESGRTYAGLRNRQAAERSIFIGSDDEDEGMSQSEDECEEDMCCTALARAVTANALAVTVKGQMLARMAQIKLD